MAGSRAQPPTPEGVHLVLYDGVCGLCNRLLHFIAVRDRRAVFSFAPLQGSLGRRMVERFGRNPDELTSFYVLADYRSNRVRLLDRSRATLFVAGELGWPWKAAVLLRILPAFLLDVAYDLVARTRYRMFGRFDACPLPPPELRRRFIDA